MSSGMGALAVGAELEGPAHPADLEAWNRFAAVNDEFVDIHMDDAAAAAAGFPSAFGMGNLLWSYVHEMFGASLGSHDSLQAVSLRFKTPALRHRVVTAAGVVTAVERRAEGTAVDFDIRVTDNLGTVLATGTAQVVHRLEPGCRT
jgi:acyl dehydratase